MVHLVRYHFLLHCSEAQLCCQGHVFSGTDISTGDGVAVKVESVGAKYPQLIHESKMYQMLTPAVGIPSIRAAGSHFGFNYIVLDRLGPSLESVFNHYNHLFTLKTILFFAQQMVRPIFLDFLDFFSHPILANEDAIPPF